MEQAGGLKCELYNDNFQNYKVYGIPKAQLVIADMAAEKEARKQLYLFKE